MSADFVLHPILARDTLPVSTLDLCDLLLMNDCRFPWCILVPRIDGLREWHEVPQDRRATLDEEIEGVSKRLLELSGVETLNVGALGNRVEQLHIHIVARHRHDEAWPEPVWGFGAAVSYSPQSAQVLIDYLSEQL
jgi:diadenosine tetraphosphate (Ap4A) HIT family hydrolase